MTSMKRSVSATDKALPAIAELLKPDHHQGDDGREHCKAAVDRIRDFTLDIPMPPASLTGDRVEQGRAARRRGR